MCHKGCTKARCECCMKKIFTNGCFEILHRGHVELLKYCKSLGHVIVGLNTDPSVKQLKGEGRPINNQIDRKFLLESLKYVDEVRFFDEKTPLNLIKEVKPEGKSSFVQT